MLEGQSRAELHLPSRPGVHPTLHQLPPTAPTPRPAGPPLLLLTVLHLDNIAGGHPIGGDEDIVGALDADEILHGGRKREAAGSTERRTSRVHGLTSETAHPDEAGRDAHRATARAVARANDVSSREREGTRREVVQVSFKNVPVGYAAFGFLICRNLYEDKAAPCVRSASACGSSGFCFVAR